MKRQFTTFEQAHELYCLGLEAKTADMTYYYKDDGLMDKPQMVPFSERRNKRFYVPCWSLGALIDLMPIKIRDNTYTRVIIGNQIQYEYNMGLHYDKDFRMVFVHSSNFELIDNAFEIMRFLLRNNLIK